MPTVVYPQSDFTTSGGIIGVRQSGSRGTGRSWVATAAVDRGASHIAGQWRPRKPCADHRPARFRCGIDRPTEGDP